MEVEGKLQNVGLLILLTLAVAKLISLFLKQKSPTRLPPAIVTWPVVGGLIRFVKGPVQMLKEEHLKLGSVFTVNLLSKKITFLIGPEVSAHFFNGYDSDLNHPAGYRFKVPVSGPGTIYDTDNDKRREQIRFHSESLKVNMLKGYVDQMLMETQEYFSGWGNSGEVDINYELMNLITLTSRRCLLGEEKQGKLSEDISPLIHHLTRGTLPISVISPHLPIPAHRRRDQARKKLGEIFAKIIATRKHSGKSEKDMLQTFIDSMYKDGRQTTESEVAGFLITILFDGLNSSSIIATWTGAYLLSNKKYLLSVLDEQENLVKKHGNNICQDILSEMDVLKRCIKEASRLQPTAMMLFRGTDSGFSVKTREGKVYDIPKGQIVATSPAIANRLPHVFKDPNTFDPDRFAPGREEDKVAGPFSYISFGGGRHACPGEKFAYLQIKAIWSHLLRNFELELVSPFPEADYNSMVVGVKGKVMVRYKRREVPI